MQTTSRYVLFYIDVDGDDDEKLLWVAVVAYNFAVL